MDAGPRGEEGEDGRSRCEEGKEDLGCGWRCVAIRAPGGDVELQSDLGVWSSELRWGWRQKFPGCRVQHSVDPNFASRGHGFRKRLLSFCCSPSLHRAAVWPRLQSSSQAQPRSSAGPQTQSTGLPPFPLVRNKWGRPANSHKRIPPAHPLVVRSPDKTTTQRPPGIHVSQETGPRDSASTFLGEDSGLAALRGGEGV